MLSLGIKWEASISCRDPNTPYCSSKLINDKSSKGTDHNLALEGTCNPFMYYLLLCRANSALKADSCATTLQWLQLRGPFDFDKPLFSSSHQFSQVKLTTQGIFFTNKLHRACSWFKVFSLFVKRWQRYTVKITMFIINTHLLILDSRNMT